MTSTHTLSGDEFDRRNIAGWSQLNRRIATRLITGEFAVGVQLVQQIGAAADEQDHHPDLDLRYGHLDITMWSHDAGGVTERDVRLALTINDLAAAAEVRVEPSQRQLVEWALDTPEHTQVHPFWNAVTGLAVDHGLPGDEVVEPSGQIPTLWFQTAPENALQTSGQRFHPDLWVDPAQVPGRIAAAIEAGGRLVSDDHAPSFWVLADPDGNHVCLCTWQDRT